MMNPEDEAFLLVKEAIDLRAALQSAAIAAARARRVGQNVHQGLQLLQIDPSTVITPQNDLMRQSPGLRPAGASSAYAPMGAELEGAY